MGTTATLREIDTRLLRYRLDKPVGGSGVAAVDVLVTRAALADGTEGLGFSYVLGAGAEPALAAARRLATALPPGTPLDAPEACWRRLAGTLNRTRRGPNFVALAALDVALWDAHARRLGISLAVALGGSPRAVPVYGSGGFTAGQEPGEAAATARAHAARGLRGVKPRASCTAGDAGLLRAVRDALPGDVELMVDANEKGRATTAVRLIEVARDTGALFVEEPLPADDAAGYRALAASGAVIATGEHLQGTVEALPFLSGRLCALIQPDLAMMGGLTESLRVARLAETFGIEVSPHFLPGLFVHLAAVAPNLSWLEEFPLIEPLFSGWPDIDADGRMSPRDAPGHGLALREDAEREFALPG